MRLPILDIHTVGAGGGSLARVDSGGALRVGPESAGANPGPACYGLGGKQVTVTDSNLLAGRIAPERFLGGRMALDEKAAALAMRMLATHAGLSDGAAAHGVLRVVNANMEHAIRHVSIERGYDTREFTLVAFGGAGPLHACALAESLEIPRVLVPRYPGVLSALGMLHADLMKDYSRSVVRPADDLGDAELAEWYAPMLERARREMTAEGIPAAKISVLLSADLRYAGQSYELTVPYDDLTSTLARFHLTHLQRFSHSDERLPVEVVTLRAKAIGQTPKPRMEPAAASRVPQTIREAHTDRERLQPGDRLIGPAVIYQYDATTYLAEGWEGTVDAWLNIVACSVSKHAQD